MQLILQDELNGDIIHDWPAAGRDHLPVIVVQDGVYFQRTAIQDSRALYTRVSAGQVAVFGVLQKPLIKSDANTGAPEPVLPLNDHTTPNRRLAPLAAAPPPSERETCTIGAAEYRSVRDQRDKLLERVKTLIAEGDLLRAAASGRRIGREIAELEVKQLKAENERLHGERDKLLVEVHRQERVIVGHLENLEKLGREAERLRNTTIAHGNATVQQLQSQVLDLTDRLHHVRDQRNQNLREAQKYKGQLHRLYLHLDVLELDRAGRFAADQRAIALWRQGDPTREIHIPDHADLCLWLLNLLDSSHAREEANHNAIDGQQTYIGQLEDVGEGKSQALVAAQQLCRVAQEQRDRLMDECNKILADVCGVGSAPSLYTSPVEHDPLITTASIPATTRAEMVRFFEACRASTISPAPGTYRNYARWIEELNQADGSAPVDVLKAIAVYESTVAELSTRRDELLASNNRLVEAKRTLERDNQNLEQERDRWKQAFGEEYGRGGKVLRGVKAMRDMLDDQIPRQGRDHAATPLAASAAGHGMNGRVEENEPATKKDRGAGTPQP